MIQLVGGYDNKVVARKTWERIGKRDKELITLVGGPISMNGKGTLTCILRNTRRDNTNRMVVTLESCKGIPHAMRKDHHSLPDGRPEFAFRIGSQQSHHGCGWGVATVQSGGG